MKDKDTPMGLWIIIGLSALSALHGPYIWYFENEPAVVGFGGLLLGLLIGLGLYKRLNFVRIMFIILTFLALIPDLIWMSVVTNPLLTREDFLYGVLPKIFGILLGLCLIFYLTMPKIKILFGRETHQTSNYNRPYFFVGMSLFIVLLYCFGRSGLWAKLLFLGT